MNKILVQLPANRDYAGTLEIQSADGKRIAGPFPVCGRADDESAKRNRNPGRDPLLPFGDIPFGEYQIAKIIATGTGTPYAADEFGSAGLVLLRPKSGDAALADANGRFGFFIQGGERSKKRLLRPTSDGSLRLSDSDQRRFIKALQKMGENASFCLVVRTAKLGAKVAVATTEHPRRNVSTSLLLASTMAASSITGAIRQVVVQTLPRGAAMTLAAAGVTFVADHHASAHTYDYPPGDSSDTSSSSQDTSSSGTDNSGNTSSTDTGSSTSDTSTSSSDNTSSTTDNSGNTGSTDTSSGTSDTSTTGSDNTSTTTDNSSSTGMDNSTGSSGTDNSGNTSSMDTGSSTLDTSTSSSDNTSSTTDNSSSTGMDNSTGSSGTDNSGNTSTTDTGSSTSDRSSSSSDNTGSTTDNSTSPGMDNSSVNSDTSGTGDTGNPGSGNSDNMGTSGSDNSGSSDVNTSGGNTAGSSGDSGSSSDTGSGTTSGSDANSPSAIDTPPPSDSGMNGPSPNGSDTSSGSDTGNADSSSPSTPAAGTDNSSADIAPAPSSSDAPPVQLPSNMGVVDPNAVSGGMQPASDAGQAPGSPIFQNSSAGSVDGSTTGNSGSTGMDNTTGGSGLDNSGNNMTTGGGGNPGGTGMDNTTGGGGDNSNGGGGNTGGGTGNTDDGGGNSGGGVNDSGGGGGNPGTEMNNTGDGLNTPGTSGTGNSDSSADSSDSGNNNTPHLKDSLPGIYLKDDTGNGRDVPYGISGLRGVYVNGPRDPNAATGPSDTQLRPLDQIENGVRAPENQNTTGQSAPAENGDGSQTPTSQPGVNPPDNPDASQNGNQFAQPGQEPASQAGVGQDNGNLENSTSQNQNEPIAQGDTPNLQQSQNQTEQQISEEPPPLSPGTTPTQPPSPADTSPSTQLDAEANSSQDAAKNPSSEGASAEARLGFDTGNQRPSAQTQPDSAPDAVPAEKTPQAQQTLQQDAPQQEVSPSEAPDQPSEPVENRSTWGTTLRRLAVPAAVSIAPLMSRPAVASPPPEPAQISRPAVSDPGTSFPPTLDPDALSGGLPPASSAGVPSGSAIIQPVNYYQKAAGYNGPLTLAAPEKPLDSKLAQFKDTIDAMYAAASCYDGGQAPPGYAIMQRFTLAQFGTDAVLYGKDGNANDLILAFRGSTTEASVDYKKLLLVVYRIATNPTDRAIFDGGVIKPTDDTIVDWGVKNLDNLNGDAQAYVSSVLITRLVQKEFPDAQITLAGHSLGGGEAALASVATGLRATTFNAAGVDPGKYGYGASADASHITNYYVAKEPLTTAQNSKGNPLDMPSALGAQVMVSPVTKPHWLTNAANHGMSAVEPAVLNYLSGRADDASASQQQDPSK